MTHFDTIDYLKYGNAKQQKAFQVLSNYAVFETLVTFNPILAGTIPIEIDIETSDLDIICEWTEKQHFIDFLTTHFSHFTGFKYWSREIHGQDSVIASFRIEDFEVEIFGQNIPTKEQFAYKHLIIEHQILQKHGEKFKEKVIALKKEGIKTEPAFAQLLGLKGDPYLELLKVNYKKIV